MNSPEPALAGHWSIPGGVTCLNHGSFGPSPLVVQQAREEWSRRLEREPMDFFVRRLEGHLDEAAARLGAFVGADGSDLIFVDNATAGMNIVAVNTPLGPGDEVLLTDHEYGAVTRIWRTACDRSGADLAVASLPSPFETEQAVTEAVLERVSERTKLIVVSHVTSPTAVILPVADICREARRRGVAVCIDGPHALAMLPLEIERLGCDFYTASCHKWLCGPFGSGFLYAARRRQQGLQPAITSWGGSVSGRPASWKDEFTWQGTRDPAAFLAVPAAIGFLEEFGLERFRETTGALARYARERIVELTGLEPLVPDSPQWYGSMIALPLPPSPHGPPKPGRRDPLQDALFERYGIEVPIVHWRGRRFVRVSCHLYNDAGDIDRLMDALGEIGAGT